MVSILRLNTIPPSILSGLFISELDSYGVPAVKMSQQPINIYKLLGCWCQLARVALISVEGMKDISVVLRVAADDIHAVSIYSLWLEIYQSTVVILI